MNVNFIITCFNRTEHLDGLLAVLRSYKTVVPSVCLSYNGDDPKFKCSVRAPNRGHQEGDLDLTQRGYRYFLARNNTQRFIKLGIDSWLCDEKVIINIFNRMEEKGCGYGGNRWGTEIEEAISTDIFFLDTAFNHPFEGVFRMDGPNAFEHWMWRNCLYHQVKMYMVPERIPVHPKKRHECAALKWTMHHEVQKNLENLRKWGYGALISKGLHEL